MSNDTVATTFADLGVSTPVVDALHERGISEAFPIQTATIEAGLSGRDICGKAPTGSGKTLAFGIPAVDLANKGTPWCPSVLILSPTRELATQIKDEIAPLAKARKRSVLTVFGGTNIQRDIKRLEQGVDILVACPGRLEDLIGRRCCELRNVELAIIDEADRMADMGFLPSVKRILDQTPSNRHMMLFSATLDGDVDTLIKRYQRDPLTFEVEEQVGEIGDVEHSWYLVQPTNRVGSAVAVLQRYYSSIVFCRTRRGCDRVAKMFNKNGLSAVAIHGDRSQSQRERALADFTKGKAQVLVATDVAARGIHVDNVSLVMHYDPAGSDKDYIHRSGRTGRAGQDGRVISMVVEDKKKIARNLQKDLGFKPGFDDIEEESLNPIVSRPVVLDDSAQQRKGHGKGQQGKHKPRNKQGAQRKEGQRRDRSDGKGRGNGQSQNRQKNRNRNDRDRDNRNDRDRDDRDNRNRNDRDRDNRKGHRNDRDRDNRNRNDRNRKDWDRDDRDRDRNGQKRRPQRRRQGSNDWYPPGYYDDDKAERGRGGKRSASGNRNRRNEDDRRSSNRSKSGKRTSGSRNGSRNDGRTDERDERHGGSGTKQRKPRNTKGRHADESRGKNKGKRRSPRR